MAPRPASAPPATPRLREFDVLRGVAVLLVLGRHMDAVPADVPVVAGTVLYLWERAGWIGVDLFFVLSGFLVSGLLFREYGRTGDVRIGRFLGRRGLRIYPAFYAFLVVTSIAAGTIGTRGFFVETVFIQNYAQGLWDHTWSLAVEEHFYILLALVATLLVRTDRGPSGRLAEPPHCARDPFATLVPLFVVVAVIELGLRIATARYGKASFVHHLYPTHLRLDSLLCGVVLSYLAWSRGDRFAGWVSAHRPQLVLTSVLCLAPPLFLPAIDPFIETVGFTLLYVGFGAVLLLARPTLESARPGRPLSPVTHRIWASSRGLAASGLAWIGVYSYSIYLWHLAVKRWGLPLMSRAFGWQPNTLAAFLGYVGASLIVGAIMAKAIEIPILAARERWLPVGGGNAASADPSPPLAPVRPAPLPAR